MGNTDGQTSAQKPPKKSGVFGWMLFDWAAQPTFTVVTTFIFGPYFVARLTNDPVSAQASWANMATIASILVAMLSPVLGAIADKTGRKKPWIGAFAAIQVLALSLLWFAAPGTPIIWPIIFMILVTLSAEFSIVFNDSMMPRLVAKADIGKISNIAWGLGYCGGMIVLIGVVCLIAANPETGKTILGIAPLFGLDPKTGEDARIVGPIAAIWYLIFILPMFVMTPDAQGSGTPMRSAVTMGFAELKSTLGELRTHAGLKQFLIARMIYQDGVNALLFLGGAFAASIFGWATLEIGIYGIILNLVAIPSCIAAGFIDARLGSKKTVIISLLCLIISALGFIATTPQSTLFGLIPLSEADAGGLFGTMAEKCFVFFGLFTGLAFGPVQASSRSYLARSIRQEDAGRYFGIYALSGRATSFMGTLAFSSVTYLTGSSYLGMATIIVFFVIGLALLAKTPYPASQT